MKYKILRWKSSRPAEHNAAERRRYLHGVFCLQLSHLPAISPCDNMMDITSSYPLKHLARSVIESERSLDFTFHCRKEYSNFDMTGLA